MNWISKVGGGVVGYSISFITTFVTTSLNVIVESAIFHLKLFQKEGTQRKIISVPKPI